MAITLIGLGATDNDGTGTPLKSGGTICNDNFTELDARGLPLVTGEATEALVALNAVNQYGSGGALGVRKANATDTTKQCDGFVKVNVANGDPAIVYPLGCKISGFPAATFTPGDRFYLDTTGGQITNAPPAVAGNIVQEVAQAITDTELQTYRMPWVGI